MNKNDLENKMDQEDILTGNAAEDMPKEPTQDDVLNESDNEADNATEEIAKLKDSYLRLMAEYDNYRKRTIKEKADLIKSGGEKVLLGLLPVADDFERALDTIHNAKDMESVKEGVELIYHKFLTYLQQNGVKRIEAVGEPFDEEYCEAVATMPAQDEDQKGKVIDDVQTGYTLNDKVIRHAKVVVAN
ncbi:MAG: nucleotide exchange factor GrpE [Bacteroidales bacterium]|nr:nucleotide exchange factor GrpE [Bacteroidales bacterium]